MRWRWVISFFRSLRTKMLLWFFALILPMMILLIWVIRTATDGYAQQARINIDQTLLPYVAQIDAALSTARRYIAHVEADLYFMADDGDADEFARLRDMTDMNKRVSEDLVTYPDIETVFLYNGDKLWFIQNYGGDYVENSRVANRLKEHLKLLPLDALLYRLGYMRFEADGRDYLFSAIAVKNGVMGFWISADHLLGAIREARLSGMAQVMFADQQSPTQDGDIAGRSSAPFVVSRNPLSAAPFQVNVLWDPDVIFSPIYQMRRTMVIAVIVAVVLFLSYVLFLRLSLARPLNRLVRNIDAIRGGSLTPIPLPQRENTEIMKVYEALNAMIGQIETMRIQALEEKLIKQRAQMQVYQLQLRPHFFLNALNTVLSFARMGQYAMVQKMTTYLAAHCRYILYNSWFVSLEEELDYTQNFVNMQSLQRDIQYHYIVRVTDDALLDQEVPILSIQIFVENAIKYAATLHSPLEIHVSIDETAEDTPLLRIRIDDSGAGFSAETLETLNDARMQDPVNMDHGVGIFNIRQRLRILYSDRASIVFSNNEIGGAHIELLLPRHAEGGLRP